MADIEVTATDPRTFRVEVTEEDGSSTHRVAVPDGYPEELGLGDAEPAELVRASFRFLLEREPRGSIMSVFELPVIERYFPAYPDEIDTYLS